MHEIARRIFSPRGRALIFAVVLAAVTIFAYRPPGMGDFCGTTTPISAVRYVPRWPKAIWFVPRTTQLSSSPLCSACVPLLHSSSALPRLCCFCVVAPRSRVSSPSPFVLCASPFRLALRPLSFPPRFALPSPLLRCRLSLPLLAFLALSSRFSFPVLFSPCFSFPFTAYLPFPLTAACAGGLLFYLCCSPSPDVRLSAWSYAAVWCICFSSRCPVLLLLSSAPVVPSSLAVSSILSCCPFAGLPHLFFSVFLCSRSLQTCLPVITPCARGCPTSDTIEVLARLLARVPWCSLRSSSPAQPDTTRALYRRLLL